MAKKRRDKTPYVPPIDERTAFSIRIRPGHAITVDGPAAIDYIEHDDTGSLFRILALPEVTIVHVKDAEGVLYEPEPEEE